MYLFLKFYRYLFLSSILFLLSTTKLYSIKFNDYLTLSGFLRTRLWNFYINTSLPEQNKQEASQKYINYIDLFYRMRLDIQPIDKVSIYSVFDVSTVFGASEKSSNEVKLIVRNLYGEFRPTKYINISFGLLPFTLSGGYVLAKNGAGLKYEHRIYKEFINLYIFWIKAVENSLTDSNQDGLGDAEKRDDDIYIFGNKMFINRITLVDFYYIFRNDQHEHDGTLGKKHWLATHTKSNYKSWILEMSIIYNFGKVGAALLNNKAQLNAGLWASYIGYNFEYWEIGFRHEGATGNNIRAKQDRSSFQTIAHSRGLSYIFADDSGGISIRTAGKLFGTYSNSLEIILNYFDDIELSLKYFHYRSFQFIEGLSNSASNYLGDEINTYLRYNYTASIFFELITSIFFPNDAYQNWLFIQNKEPIFETLLKVQINY